MPPPSVGSSASGCSRSITLATDSGVSGSMYVARGELRVGHDRRRVRVDEDDLVALLEQHLAGLRARVVELGRLADDDRTGAEDEDAVDVVSTRH